MNRLIAIYPATASINRSLQDLILYTVEHTTS